MKDLESELTIANAASAAERLKSCVSKEKKPIIDLSVIEKIDLSGIQLLIAAQKTGERLKKDVWFTGVIKKNVYERLFHSGFNTVHSGDSESLYKIRRNSSEI